MSVTHTLKRCKKAVSKGQMLVGFPLLVTMEGLIPLFSLHYEKVIVTVPSMLDDRAVFLFTCEFVFVFKIFDSHLAHLFYIHVSLTILYPHFFVSV